MKYIPIACGTSRIYNKLISEGGLRVTIFVAVRCWWNKNIPIKRRRVRSLYYIYTSHFQQIDLIESLVLVIWNYLPVGRQLPLVVVRGVGLKYINY